MMMMMMVRRGGGGRRKGNVVKCGDEGREREGCDGKNQKVRKSRGEKKKEKKQKVPPQKKLRVSEERGRVGAVQGVGTTRVGWPA